VKVLISVLCVELSEGLVLLKDESPFLVRLALEGGDVDGKMDVVFSALVHD